MEPVNQPAYPRGISLGQVSAAERAIRGDEQSMYAPFERNSTTDARMQVAMSDLTHGRSHSGGENGPPVRDGPRISVLLLTFEISFWGLRAYVVTRR